MSVPSSRKRSGTRGYAHLIELEAPVARVWRALTDPALMRIWYGGEAEIDARKGGLYRLGRAGFGGREAHIDIFDVNRRLRLIYMNGPNFPHSDSAIVDDFLLDMRAGEGLTSLRLLGSGFPEDEAWNQSYARIRLGWERFLARIKVTLENPPQPKKAEPAAPPVDPPLRGLDY
ncbi:MAG: SRPBCC family protein [Steroidobacteraceae bacterium]|jgi:uncharacterized protein YndB with AHSA1/START domain